MIHQTPAVLLLKLLSLIFVFTTRIQLAVPLESGCAKPLGLISGAIADWQISASSSSVDSSSQAKCARVHAPPGHAWCAERSREGAVAVAEDNGHHWVMVDLGVAETWVAGLIVQGRERDGDGDGAVTASASAWTTAFEVSYIRGPSLSSGAWKHVRDVYGAKRVFQVEIESEARQPVTIWLEEPFRARFVRVHLLEWVGEPCLRLELLGCQECGSIVSGLGSETRVTASTSTSSTLDQSQPLISCQPEESQLETHSGWCASRNDVHQWLQFEFSVPTLVTGLVTRGHGGHGHGHALRAWVTGYTLSYSNDSLVWYSYKDQHHPHQVVPKVFGGNMDRGTERRHFLNTPFTCRSLRLHPVHWHGAIAMRAAVIGCPASVQGVNSVVSLLPVDGCPEGFFRARLNPLGPCIQNLAYRKEVWTNDKKHFWPAQEWKHGHVSRAVDGKGNFSRAGTGTLSLSECAVLDNYYTEQPVWMVDLGRKMEIEGVVLITWQGGDGDVDHESGGGGEIKNSTPLNVKYEDYVAGLESISVYVSNTSRSRAVIGLDDGHAHAQEKTKDVVSCGTITRENDAIFAPKLFFICRQARKRARARYVYVKPRPRIDTQSQSYGLTRIFNFVVCQVYVY